MLFSSSPGRIFCAAAWREAPDGEVHGGQVRRLRGPCQGVHTAANSIETIFYWCLCMTNASHWWLLVRTVPICCLLWRPVPIGFYFWRTVLIGAFGSHIFSYMILVQFLTKRLFCIGAYCGNCFLLVLFVASVSYCWTVLVIVSHWCFLWQLFPSGAFFMAAVSFWCLFMATVSHWCHFHGNCFLFGPFLEKPLWTHQSGGNNFLLVTFLCQLSPLVFFNNNGFQVLLFYDNFFYWCLLMTTFSYLWIFIATVYH